MKRTAAQSFLCAVNAWAGVGGIPKTTPTLRKGARALARRRGFSPVELDAGERVLVKRGYLWKPGKGKVALTATGAKVAARVCRRK